MVGELFVESSFDLSSGELEHEVRWETFGVALDGLV